MELTEINFTFFSYCGYPRLSQRPRPSNRFSFDAPAFRSAQRGYPAGSDAGAEPAAFALAAAFDFPA